MQHADFAIGTEFYSRTGKWRCTDVGSRVIVAIRIDIVNASHKTMAQAESEAEGWFSGPPYAVLETIFDEDDFEGCSPTPDTD